MIIQNAIICRDSKVVVIIDDSKPLIAHVADVNFYPKDNKKKLLLQGIYHVPGIKKNSSVLQLTRACHYVLLGPNDMKVYTNFKTLSQPITCEHRA